MSEGRNGSFSRKNGRETSPADENHLHLGKQVCRFLKYHGAVALHLHRSKAGSPCRNAAPTSPVART